MTREQIAVILMEYMTRVLKLERTWTPADLSIFPDADSVSDWAKDAMADAVALGLISGASNGGQTYPRAAGQRDPRTGRDDPDGVLQKREKVIQLSGCTLQILRGASFCGRWKHFSFFLPPRVVHYTVQFYQEVFFYAGKLYYLPG
ncbi:MAG: S-layer homology domain-containing protein [Oscillospiraceae bacterium]